MSTIKKDRRCEFTAGVDAVFLPGKIHGCEDQLYIIYFNESANDEEGCWEIEIVDFERILKLFADVDGNADEFFGILPDLFHGEWYYCDYGEDMFDEYADAYYTADFICGRDGGAHAEMMFLVNWAKERAKTHLCKAVFVEGSYIGSTCNLCVHEHENWGDNKYCKSCNNKYRN